MSAGTRPTAAALGAALIIVITLIAYIPAMNAGYVWDDDDYVTHNPLITAPDGLSRIWLSLDSPSQYFPLVYTTFRIEHALWGFDPRGYHIVNIVLHILNALLVWYLLRRLRVPGAWLAAAIFAIHPVHVESVAWITELKNVLSTLFYLLAVIAWMRFTDGSTAKPWRYYLSALILCALALFAKTTACTLPAVLLLVLWMKGLPVDRRRLVQVFSFVVMGIAMGLVSIWWEQNHQGTRGPEFAFAPVERILIAGRALWFYLGKLAWPSQLTFSYPRWTIDAGNPLQYLWVLACAALATVLWRWRKQLGRPAVAAAVFFPAMLAPMLGFISLYTFRYSFVADHYQYLASVGPIALFAAGLSMLTRRRRIYQGIAVVMLVVLGTLTWNQASIYKDAPTLWRDTIAKNPGSWIAYGELGGELFAQGKADEAVALYRKSLAIQPHQSESHCSLGAALVQERRIDEALPHFNEALKIDPRCAQAHYNLGLVLSQQGKLDEAVEHYTEALRLNPDDAECHYFMGVALAIKGRMDEAVSHVMDAVDIDPGLYKAQTTLGQFLAARGDIKTAISHFKRAVESEPDYLLAHRNLALAYYMTGDYTSAWSEVKQCRRCGWSIDPRFLDALGKKMKEPQ